MFAFNNGQNGISSMPIQDPVSACAHAYDMQLRINEVRYTVMLMAADSTFQGLALASFFRHAW